MNMKYDGFPAFQEYPADYLGNRDWRCLTLAQRGLLQTMRFECWTVGNVPADQEELAQCVGIAVDELAKMLTSKVLQYFNKVGDSYVCEALDNYKAYLVNRREKMVEGGRKGGKKTQGKVSLSHPSSLAQANIKPLSKAKLSEVKLNQEKLCHKEDGYDLEKMMESDGVPTWLK